MQIPTQSLNIAQKYFESLPEDDINRKYYNGVKYVTPQVWFRKLLNTFQIQKKIDTLENFYPYQKSLEDIKQDSSSTLRNYQYLTTGALWFIIYNFAKQNKVANVLNEYGMLFKTHRIFRHYIWAAIIPYIGYQYCLNSKFYDVVENQWIIHTRRLNKKNIDDPEDTYYPLELRFIHILISGIKKRIGF